jgi:hypothetical protein
VYKNVHALTTCLFPSHQAPDTRAQAKETLQAAFTQHGLSSDEALLVAEALVRRAESAHKRSLAAGTDGTGADFESLNELNKWVLRFGQSRYSSGVRLLPDGEAQTGKLQLFPTTAMCLPVGACVRMP